MNSPFNAVSIRTAEVADIERIFELHLIAIRELCISHYSSDTIDRWLHGRKPAGFNSCVAEESCFVALLDSDIAGFCCATPGEVSALFVDPAHARSGIGSQILTHALQIARQEHVGPVRVESTLNAVDFYTHHGFVVVEHTTARRNNVELPVVIMEIQQLDLGILE